MIKPIGTYILVRRLAAPAKSPGGAHLSPVQRVLHDRTTTPAEVFAFGDKVKKRLMATIAYSDTVLIYSYDDRSVPEQWNPEGDLFLVDQTAVIARLGPGDL